MPRTSKYGSEEERKQALKERDKIRRKEREDEREAAGLCTGCGKEPAKTGCKLGQVCIDKSTECSNRRYYKNKEEGTCRVCGGDSGGKARCAVHEAIAKARIRKFMAKRREKGLCIFCKKPPKLALPGKCYCEEHRQKGLAYGRRRNARHRKRVFDNYGRECYCCGQTIDAFLQIDHIENNGAEHRRLIGKGGLYLWLIRNNFPPEYRTACSDCNWSRSKLSLDDKCPHEHLPSEVFALIRETNKQVAILLRDHNEDQTANPR